MTKNSKLWGGRFEVATDQVVADFSASVHFDSRLYAEDIAGSIAHALMLGDVGVLASADVDAIVGGLESIKQEIESGTFVWSSDLEDVHMNIEARLTELVGDAGKRLHTGRSRNDQVATDVRLWLKRHIDEIVTRTRQLQQALVDQADAHAATIMPGYTHLQTAQPVTLGHHLLAYFEMLDRDVARYKDVRGRTDVSPLGSAALAGTSYPIDRSMTATSLGFGAVSANSLDSVSDRDFAIEFASAAALQMVHLSRMSEELVLWASQQFGFADLGDGFCTGSSIMPQKKNPDVAELVRGKTARVNGNLHALLMLMKGQPMTYNRDNQEDKEPLFDSVDTVLACLDVMARMVPQIKFNSEAMRDAALAGFSTATDLADYLVRKGVPFRDAHEVVGRTVRHAQEHGITLDQIELKTLRSFSAEIEDDVYGILTLEGSVNSRSHTGATAPARVRDAVADARGRLAD